MAEKKKTANKAEKKTTAKKPAKVDLDSLGPEVTIIGVSGSHLEKGKEYNVTIETAKILIGKGVAKLA